jgi:TP901 family phage tail tape measure protein
MSRNAVKAGNAYVEIGIRNRIAAGARGVQADLDKLGRKVTAMGGIISGMGLALSAPFAFAARSVANFDDAIRATGAVSQSTSAQLEMLKNTALELGRTTSFTALEVASLMTELGRAGFDPTQIDNMTGAVLDLARATGTDAALAAGIMAATIRQFGMEAADGARVADVLTSTANKTFNTVEQLGEALKYAGPVAADFNMSIEETAAILGTLGNVGIQASSAGTTLRRLLTITGAEAQRLQEIFGVSFVDAAGNARPLVQTLGEVQAATADMGTALRSEKFNEAFGLLGITGASAIGKVTVETEKLYQDLLASQGAARKTAVEMDAGLGGAFRILTSAIEGATLAIGESFAEELRIITDLITGAIGGITKWVGANKEITAAIAVAGVAMVGTGAAILALGVASQVAASGIGMLQTVFGGLMSVVSGVATVFGLVRATMAAFTAATLSTAAVLATLRLSVSSVATGMILMNAAYAVSPAIAAAVATAWSGVGIVLGGLSSIAGFVSATAGVMSAAWAGSSGVAALVSTAWAGVSFVITSLSGVAAAGAASGGIIGLAWSAVGLVLTAVTSVAAIASGAAGAMSAAWTASSGVAAFASAAWAGIGFVITALTGPVALGTALAGVLSAAWSTAAAAAASAWAAMAAPLLPFIAAATVVIGIVAVIGAAIAAVAAVIVGVMVAIAGAAAYAAIAASDFGSAWGILTKAFSDSMAIIKDAFGTIKDALAVGDYSTAVQALWLAIQAGFWVGVEATFEAFKWLFREAWGITKRFFSNLLDFTLRVMKAVAKAIMNPFAAAREIGAAISELISGATSFDVSARVSGSQAALKALRDQTAATRARADAEKEAQRIREESMTQEERRAVQLEKINELERQGQLTAEEASKARAKVDRELPAATPAQQAAAKREQVEKDVKSGKMSRFEADTVLEDVSRQEATDKKRRQEDLKDQLEKGEITPGQFEKQMAAIDGLSDSYFDLVKGIEMEIFALEQGEEAAERKRLADEGLNDQQIKDIETLKAKKKALEEMKAVQEAMADQRVAEIFGKAQQFEMQGMAPDEIFKRVMDQLAKDQNAGIIDDDQADQARAKAQENLQKQLGEQGASPAEVFKQVMGQIQQAQAAGRLDPADAAAARARAQDNLQAGMDNLRNEGRQLAAALATPQEKLQAELARIQQIRNAGGFNDDAAKNAEFAKRAEDKAREDFEDTQEKGTDIDETIEQEKALGPTGTFSGFAVGSGAFGGNFSYEKQSLKKLEMIDKNGKEAVKHLKQRQIARAG